MRTINIERSILDALKSRQSRPVADFASGVLPVVFDRLPAIRRAAADRGVTTTEFIGSALARATANDPGAEFLRRLERLRNDDETQNTVRLIDSSDPEFSPVNFRVPPSERRDGQRVIDLARLRMSDILDKLTAMGAQRKGLSFRLKQLGVMRRSGPSVGDRKSVRNSDGLNGANRQPPPKRARIHLSFDDLAAIERLASTSLTQRQNLRLQIIREMGACEWNSQAIARKVRCTRQTVCRTAETVKSRGVEQAIIGCVRPAGRAHELLSTMLATAGPTTGWWTLDDIRRELSARLPAGEPWPSLSGAVREIPGVVESKVKNAAGKSVLAFRQGDT